MTKIKAGTPFLLDGKEVFVEHDMQNGFVNVCHAKSRLLTDFYEVVGIDTLLPVKRAIVGLKNKPSKTVENINSKSDLDKWFESQEVPERCENCNQKLNAFNKWAKRCVTAHILPKSLFPEVATHPLNRAFLGTHLFSDCSCHPLWDNSDAEHRKQMRVYPINLQRVKEFIHLIPESKLNKAEKYLGLNELK